MQNLTHLTLVFLLFCGLSASANAPKNRYKTYELKTLQLGSQTYRVYLAKTSYQRALGLSHLTIKDFPKNSGMLFVGKENKEREFWMKDTYFDIDIAYLDLNMKVLKIVKNLKKSPPETPHRKIAVAPVVKAVHVLEFPSKINAFKNLKVGENIIFSSDHQEITPSTHPGR